MADISKITLPSGTTYDIKDAVARATAGGGIQFRGVTTTELTDGATTSTYQISGETNSRTAENADMVVYGSKEFVFSSSDDKWHELGDNSALKALAYKDNASGTYIGVASVSVTTKSTSNKTTTVSATNGTTTYTPAGEVSAPTISLASAGLTTTINNPTAKELINSIHGYNPNTAVPQGTNINFCSVENETLTLNKLIYLTTASISTSNVTVKTGDATYTASQPTFSGTGVKLVTDNIPVPSEYTATITTENKTVTVS